VNIRVFIIGALILLTMQFAARGDNGLDFSVGPAAAFMYGHSEYYMDISGVDSTGTPVRLRSKLDFPLDAGMAGVTAIMGKKIGSIDDWSVKMDILINWEHPDGVMRDEDWRTGYTEAGFFDGKFSETESKTEMKHLLVVLQGAKCLRHGDRSATFICGGIRYQRISQEILGYNGWQINIYQDPTFTPHHFRNDTLKVLDYRVTFITPLIGIVHSFRPGVKTSIDFKAAGLTVFASDFDDHLERHKAATASGIGYGLCSSFSVRYDIGGRAARLRPFVECEGEFIAMKVSAKQTQEWYGDDGTTQKDDTGLKITDIPHEIRSTQYSLGLRLGVGL
jgi:hypothetical protein